jgi:hypothetical protein
MRHFAPIIAALLLAASALGAQGITSLTNVTVHLHVDSESGTRTNLILFCNMTITNKTNVPFTAVGFALEISGLDGKKLARSHAEFIMPPILAVDSPTELKLLFGTADSPISLPDSAKTFRVRLEVRLYLPSPRDLHTVTFKNLVEAGSITSNIVEVHIP